MSSFPLLFSYRNLVAGRGFVAGVQVHGRALLVREDDNGVHWLHGVNPGGVAGGGATRGEAFKEFQDGYLSVLYDIAGEACSVEDIKRAVEEFFWQTNEPTQVEWTTALELVRRSDVSLDGLERVRTEDRPLSLEVTLLDSGQVRPTENALPEFARAA